MLYFAMLVLGASGLAYEYSFSKVSADILGNSVQQWALIIGVMMFFMGVGSDVQKYLSDDNLFDSFILLESVVALLGATGPVLLIYAYGVMPLHFVLVQYFFIISIGLIIGMEIPLITRINARFLPELRLNLAAVLKMDYIGALIGALVWVFVLITRFEISHAAFIIGFVNWAVALMTMIFFYKEIRRKLWVWLFTWLTGIALIIGFFNVKHWRVEAEQYLYRDPVIYSHTTPYQHIVLTKTQNGDIYCYINGHLQFYSGDEFIYHENLVHGVMAVAPERARVLILGGGDGLALREVLKYRDVRLVTLCDLDVQMTTLAKTQPELQHLNRHAFWDDRLHVVQKPDVQPGAPYTVYSRNRNILWRGGADSVATVHVINMDAARFLERISGTYDVIIIDFPDPNAPELSHLYSRTFYEHVRKKLSRNGLMIQQSTSPYHAREVFLCIGKTMRAAGLSTLPLKDNVPSFGEWGWWIAGRNDVYSPSNLRQRINNVDTLTVPTHYLTAATLKSNLIFPKGILPDETIEVNALGTNIIYRYYQMAWQNE